MYTANIMGNTENAKIIIRRRWNVRRIPNIVIYTPTHSCIHECRKKGHRKKGHGKMSTKKGTRQKNTDIM